MKTIGKIAALAAGVALAGQAAALTPGQIASATNLVELYIGGATAQDGAIEQLVGDLCASMVTTYEIDTATAEAVAYACVPDVAAISGLAPVTDAIVVHKDSFGGSVRGVAPVARAEAITFVDVDATTCNGGAPITEGDSVSCTGDISMVPDAGVSDVEPALFASIQNTTIGSVPLSLSDISSLTVAPSNAILFGVPVSVPLFETLQYAQGYDVTDDESDADGVDNTPSLTTAQITSLFSGEINDWANMNIRGANGEVKSVVAWAADAGVAIGNDGFFFPEYDVKLCRRAPGSGTQAQANALFMRNPCNGSLYTARGMLPPDSNPTDPSGLGITTVVTDPANNIVVGNTGSSRVENCLEAFGAADRFAIGVQSLERNSITRGNGADVDEDGLPGISKAYRFVKIDGVLPTLENVDNGTYFDWVQPTFQWLSTLSGDKLALAQTIAAQAGRPSTIANLNLRFDHPFGQSGYLAIASTSFPADTTRNGGASAELDSDYPVTAQSRQGNTCNQPAALDFWGDVTAF